MGKLKINIFFCNILFFLLCCISAYSQQEIKKDSVIYRRDSTGETLIINKLKYRECSRWASGGIGYNINLKAKFDGNLGFDYQVLLKERYYQFGVMRGREYKGFFPEEYDRSFNELHICYGKKWEEIKKLYSVFVGPAFIYGDYLPEDSLVARGFYSIGLHANFQYIYKPVYDMGIGINFFTNVNLQYSLVGLRVVLFFSNAYKGRER